MCAGLVLLASMLVWSCNGCERKKSPQRKPDRQEESHECDFASDCASNNPCVEVDCVDGRCVEDSLSADTICLEATACQRAAHCDGRGHCVPGEPVSVDDGNLCTADSCQPTRGVVHEPVPVDDSDACTVDACDPRTGKVTHEPVEIDDGDECTLDACDPKTGVTHTGASPKYTCESSCGDGFHASSRRLSTDCGPIPQLQSFCQPNCGAAFYTCDSTCPEGYRGGTQRPSSECGPNSEPRTFCKRDTGGE